MSVIAVLLALLWIIGIGFAVFWAIEVSRSKEFTLPSILGVVVGFVTNFFDTLGIGSFAPTTSLFKFFRMVPDERIPGTLNVGDSLPTIAEALIYITVIGVEPLTLIALIVASVLGAWLGAGMVARWPRRNVQIGMGGALTAAAIIFLMQNLKLIPAGGDALGLTGGLLLTGIVINFCLGALMTIGIGLYAPAIIMISLLGMNPRSAFPIMMGSCAFLMPIASVRFVKFDAYAIKAAIGLTIGGIPGVVIAAYLVKSMPLEAVKWLVIAIVAYAAFTMLRSAYVERTKSKTPLSSQA
ncbi:MAG TPA: sulfite exporter TauE/SafE family protein [Candidatus Acidoferrales bacterium]|nr:sulfite exporter TauE/SafE family protein [Candidatus Acidoferrales bacterium]